MEFISFLKNLPILQLIGIASAILLCFYNLYGLILMGLDKLFAKYQKRRIPEYRLLGIAKKGGAAGIYGGMRMFRHKTLKEEFKLVVVWLALQLIAFMVIGYFIGHV